MPMFRKRKEFLKYYKVEQKMFLAYEATEYLENV